MLFRKEVLTGIRDGNVTLAFRRWRRPSVRSGSTLLTPVGLLMITSISKVALEAISEDDARRAGYASLRSLGDELERRKDGQVYRIGLGALLPDPRVALRNSVPADEAEVREIIERLQRMDARANGTPWTLRTLELLSANPGVRAGNLCEQVGQHKEQFKINVRKLKSLGLTVSLETGYRLSRRGIELLDSLRSADSSDAT